VFRNGPPSFPKRFKANAEIAKLTPNNKPIDLTSGITPQTKKPNQKNEKAMKHLFTGSSLIGAFALITLVVGCAGTQAQNKENLLIAAGFQVIVPKTAAQQQLLQKLPAGKVTPIQKNGKQYYVFPDAANNQAYVGGPTQYQAYRQLRLANKLANENLEAAEMRQEASMMDWGGWGGWGGAGWGRLR
jgi:hypothetical protein